MTKNEIEEIQKKYPKFNKAAASLASRPEETGVMFVDSIKPKKKKPNRIKPNRLVVYLNDWDFEAFKANKRLSNENTQMYLERIIREDIYGR